MDLDALAESIVRCGTLCPDLAEEIGEIDINPLILAPNGAGLTAVECIIARKRRGTERMTCDVAALLLCADTFITNGGEAALHLETAADVAMDQLNRVLISLLSVSSVRQERKAVPTARNCRLRLALPPPLDV